MKPFQQLYLPENQRLAEGKNTMGQNADEIVVEPEQNQTCGSERFSGLP